MAIEIPPREIERLSYEREARIDPSLFGTVTKETQIQWLTIQLGTQAASQPFVPEVVIAKTPGVMLPECLPSWSLDSIRKSMPKRCSVQTRTTTELRKARGNSLSPAQALVNLHLQHFLFERYRMFRALKQ